VSLKGRSLVGKSLVSFLCFFSLYMGMDPFFGARASFSCCFFGRILPFLFLLLFSDMFVFLFFLFLSGAFILVGCLDVRGLPGLLGCCVFCWFGPPGAVFESFWLLLCVPVPFAVFCFVSFPGGFFAVLVLFFFSLTRLQLFFFSLRKERFSFFSP